MSLETAHVLQHQKGKSDKRVQRPKILNTIKKTIGTCDIEYSHGNNFENCCLVGCETVLLGRE